MIGLLAGMVLGFGMMSDAEREKTEERARLDEMRSLLGILEWHFALSWDWNAYIETYVAINEGMAWDLMKADIVNQGGDPDGGKYRVYGIIKGGEIAHPEPTLALKRVGPGVPVSFIWQVERAVSAVTVIPKTQKTMLEIENEAWALTGEEMHEEMAMSLGEEGERYGPDLVVIGGTVVFEGSV